MRGTIARMKALIVANWKMNPMSIIQAKALLSATKKEVVRTKGIEVVIAPPSIFLRELAARATKGRVSFGAQNVHFETAGSHTGEISIPQVKEAKATYLIVGHAERRARGETNEDTQKKIAATLAAQLTPILCVGESSREANADYYGFVKEQLLVALNDIPEKKLSKVIIAYEPIWAIGGMTSMKPRDMHEMSIFIRKALVERFGEVGHSIKVLYGGSVDPENAVDMLKNGDVKGLLVGRVSTVVESMTALLRAIDTA